MSPWFCEPWLCQPRPLLRNMPTAVGEGLQSLKQCSNSIYVRVTSDKMWNYVIGHIVSVCSKLDRCLLSQGEWIHWPTNFMRSFSLRELPKWRLHSRYAFVKISGDPKIPGIAKKIFKVLVQVWNFSPLRSTPTATGCSNPSIVPNAGNNV